MHFPLQLAGVQHLQQLWSSRAEPTWVLSAIRTHEYQQGKASALKKGCCVLQRKGGDEWERAGVCTIFAETQTGSNVRKLPGRGAEQK